MSLETLGTSRLKLREGTQRTAEGGFDRYRRRGVLVRLAVLRELGQRLRAVKLRRVPS